MHDITNGATVSGTLTAHPTMTITKLGHVQMPSKIKVGPYVYTISQDVKELQAHEREKSGAFSGFCDHSLMRIVIGTDEARCSQRETMWHEVKHAVHHLFHNHRDAESSDEDHIRKMAPMELAVLRDNPDLVAFMMAED